MKRLREWLQSDSVMIPKLENLREKMKFLAAREMDVLTEIENAEIQPGIRRRQEVVHWLGTVELKRHELQCIENECKASKSQLNGVIERTAREVQELIEQGRFPNGLTLFDLKSRAFLFQMPPLSGMKFHEHVETIMGWLRDPISCPIGVQGMGGVGKTTLLKQVSNKLISDPDMKGLVHWVTVSQGCSIYNLQHKIARAIGLDLSDEEDENSREASLHARIMTIGKQQGEGKIRTFVLILDDVWDRFVVHKIGIPLGTNTCKVISNTRPGEELYCKIVLSTRSAEVCRSMGCRNFYVHVKPLSVIESWRLFVERLQNFKTLLPDVQRIAYLVAMECGCLPLAIITIAVCMRGVFSKEEWQNALDELRNLNGGHHDMENDVLRILKWSYDRLSNELLRWCFLSCVLYPEDCNIERTRLIDLWIMEGLLDDVEDRSKQINKGHAILNQLENYCLVESTLNRQGLKCIKLHDLIRDMGIYITKNHPSIMTRSGFGLSELPKKEHWKEELERVSLSCNKISEIQSSITPLTPKLTTLMLNDNPLKGIPESFFVHMKALTHLDLSFTDVVRLPESISELENLRALLLRHCNRLIYVPSVAKLTNLRVLELTDDMQIAAPKGLEILKYLEKLPHFIWKMSDVTAFNAITQLWQFVLLGRYLFRLYDEAYADEFPCVTNYYDKYQIVVNIIGGQFGEKEPRPLLPCTTQVIDIFCMTIKGKRTLIDVLPSLAGVTELNVLTVGDCTGLEYLTVSATKQQDPSIKSQLESLEELELSWLPDLKGIVEFGGYSFSRLKEFRLKSCPKIKVVFSQNMDLHLPNLRLIDVSDCNKVEEIFESDRAMVGQHDISGLTFDRFNPILYLPKLEAISLEDLPMLRSIYGGLLVCTSLGYVRTVQCAKLKLVSLSKPRISYTSASTSASLALSDCLANCIRTTDKLPTLNNENISGLVPALFVIGDSSVDCGNNNFLGTFARADHLPYGRDFDTHQPTGRFSNGRIPVDFLALKLGLPFVPSYLGLVGSIEEMIHGVNYASAGAGIIFASSTDLGQRISMAQQIQQLTDTLQRFKMEMGEDAATNLISKSIFYFSIGTNDYIHYYLLNVSGVQSSFTPWNFNHLLATSVKQGIKNLYTEGARKAVVMGLAPMGCAPHYLWRHKSKNGECIEDINNMIREFNFMMRYTVEQLNKELPDAKIIFCDTYEGSMNILENHESYGFRVTSEACCGLGSYKGWIMCLSPDMACPNASSHLWWDQYHPTDAINGLLADNVWSGLNTNICYPMNMKDMVT